MAKTTMGCITSKELADDGALEMAAVNPTSAMPIDMGGGGTLPLAENWCNTQVKVVK